MGKCPLPHYLQTTKVFLPVLVYPSLHCWLLATPTDLPAQLLSGLPQSRLEEALLVYLRQRQLVREGKETVRNGLFLQHRLIWKTTHLSVGLYTLRSRPFICLRARSTRINALLNMNKGSWIKTPNESTNITYYIMETEGVMKHLWS